MCSSTWLSMTKSKATNVQIIEQAALYHIEPVLSSGSMAGSLRRIQPQHA